MSPGNRQAAEQLRRLRTARGWSWDQLAVRLRDLARNLRFSRIGSNSVTSIKRTIARWEAGKSRPGEQYQMLLAHAYARTPLGAVELGPGSDFHELLDVLATFGIDRARVDEVASSVAATATDGGMNPLAFLGAPLRAELGAALARPDAVDIPLIDALGAAGDAVNHQIGSVPFVRLHLAQAAIVDACRHLMTGNQPPPVRARLRQVAGAAYALAARLAFETRDDAAALTLYKDAVNTSDPAEPSRRALIRSSQTMVVYYSTGDVGRARAIADAAVADARRGESVLMRARAHALQAEMAARGDGSQRHAHAALHLACHDLEGDTSGDPLSGVFSKGRLRGFEGVCGIFLGEAEAAEQLLARSATALTKSRETVQRAIVLTDRAMARLRTGGAGAPEATAAQLHECVELTAAARGRVPAQRLRKARLELRPWRGETFIAELDDHIHAALIGL
ncbi:multiprotein-bridging factor 1 family protein [Actinomadura viridis]|uniref:helix-turn-helix domain-containing protein n=1 Tax=Actinomadura viridis TaxID=58110 RepID=UPI0036B73311